MKLQLRPNSLANPQTGMWLRHLHFFVFYTWRIYQSKKPNKYEDDEFTGIWCWKIKQFIKKITPFKWKIIQTLWSISIAHWWTLTCGEFPELWKPGSGEGIWTQPWPFSGKTNILDFNSLDRKTGLILLVQCENRRPNVGSWTCIICPVCI